MGAARSILEKSTMMLLTTSKVNVRLQQESSCFLVSKSGRQQDEEIHVFGSVSFFYVAALSLCTAFVIMVAFLLQTYLRHPDSRSAKGNREGVFKKMREAMATITSVVQDDHIEEMAEKGSLAMDLAEFEVSFLIQLFFRYKTDLTHYACRRELQLAY